MKEAINKKIDKIDNRAMFNAQRKAQKLKNLHRSIEREIEKQG